MSTRMIGGVVMMHGDDSGLILRGDKVLEQLADGSPTQARAGPAGQSLRLSIQKGNIPDAIRREHCARQRLEGNGPTPGVGFRPSLLLAASSIIAHLRFTWHTFWQTSGWR